MTRRVIERGQLYFPDTNGVPYPAGTKLFVYEAGTTTKKNSYTTQGGATANANPILLVTGGLAPEAWIEGSYKLVLAPANDTDPPASPYETWDNLGPTTSTTGTVEEHNIIPNGSFEEVDSDGTTPTGWTLTPDTGNTIEVDTTDSIHGANSIKFVIASANTAVAETTNFLECQADEDLILSGALKASSASANIIVRFAYYDRTQSFISNDDVYSNSTTNPTSWSHAHVVSTPPANAAFCKIQLRIATSGVTVRFDNLRTSEAHPYTDSGILVTTAGTSTVTGTINATTGELQDNGTKLYAPSTAPTYFQASQNITLFDDVTSDPGFIVITGGATTVTKATWRTIGGTGSGATHIWTALDNVPATAKTILISLVSSRYVSGGGFCEISAYTRTGTSADATLYTARKFFHVHTYGTTNAYGVGVSMTKPIKAVFSGGTVYFGFYYTDNADSNSITLELIGYTE